MRVAGGQNAARAVKWTDRVGQRLKVMYFKGLFWDHFFLQPSLMTQMKRYFVKSLKFADDTKIASRGNTLNDIRSIQRTLDKLVAWANRWVVDFNVKKCGVMHIGKRNVEFQYQMNYGWVILVEEESDLGVLKPKIQKFSKECLLSKNKVNLMLGVINKGVSYKCAEVIS